MARSEFEGPQESLRGGCRGPTGLAGALSSPAVGLTAEPREQLEGATKTADARGSSGFLRFFRLKGLHCGKSLRGPQDRVGVGEPPKQR